MSDDELLRRTADDREAFGEFYDRHARAVLGALPWHRPRKLRRLPAARGCERRVERRGAVWFGGVNGTDRRTNRLIVDGGVEKVRPLGEGDWRVLMTEPWTPQAPGAHPLRPVVVMDEAAIELGPGEDLPREAHLTPRLQLTFENGGTRVADAR